MATLQKIPAETAIDQGLRCSFCGRKPSAGSDLIEGSDAFICDECVAACNEITADGGDDRSAGDDDGDEDTAEGAEAPVAPTFFRLLTEGDVAAVLPMDAVIEAMEGALRRLSTGGVVQPVRTAIPVADEFFAVMPAYVRDPPALGAKLVTVFARNRALDLPTHLATVLLFGPEPGARLPLSGGGSILNVGTAPLPPPATSLKCAPPPCRRCPHGSSRVTMPRAWRSSARVCRPAAICRHSSACSNCPRCACGAPRRNTRRRSSRTWSRVPRRGLSAPTPPNRRCSAPTSWCSRPRRACQS